MVPMNRLTSKNALLQLCCRLLAAHASARPEKAKQAKCLLEVQDTHYIGSVCEFTAIDKKGSFRISDTSGSGIAAEVKVTASGEGIASWTEPHLQIRNAPLGEVREAGGCWSDGSSYICAWSLDHDIYLGPYDKKRFVAYGERGGMDDEIESAVGLDTSHAVIHTKPSRRAAVYLQDYSKGGAEHAYQLRARSSNRTISADCTAKEWTGLNGVRYRFLGPIENVNRSQFRSPYSDNADFFHAGWGVLDIESNTLIEDYPVMSYAEIHDWFKKLCPSIAPAEW
jgi:hypothetical protein